MTQPIFHGGTLLHQELAAKATFDQAAAQYRGTVITAFQNVADALRAIQSDAVALQRAVASERAAARSLDIARQRLTLGDINYIGLLTAQQTYQQALINLGCRPRPVATPTRSRCSRRWAAAGGTAAMSNRNGR